MKKYTIADVHINAGNFLSRQVCVPREMPVAVAERLLNEKDECGTTNGWVFHEEGGEVQCEKDPEKKHIVFGC
jgi:hypothetical protein